MNHAVAKTHADLATILAQAVVPRVVGREGRVEPPQSRSPFLTADLGRRHRKDPACLCGMAFRPWPLWACRISSSWMVACIHCAVSMRAQPRPRRHGNASVCTWHWPLRGIPTTFNRPLQTSARSFGKPAVRPFSIWGTQEPTSAQRRLSCDTMRMIAFTPIMTRISRAPVFCCGVHAW